VIHGPFSEDFFWFDDAESDPEFLDHYDDQLSPQSSDDWGWDEWGDLVVYRPVGHEPAYKYPLLIWLTVLDEVAGVTLRDWFPDLSDRNYIGAEVHISPELSATQNSNRVSLALREIAALYGIHRQRIWIAGSGAAADWVLKLLPTLTGPITGGIAIAPLELAPIDENILDDELDRSLFLAIDSSDDPELADAFAEDWDFSLGHCHLSEWESIENSRLAICRDLNAWLMERICAPAGNDSRE
jgi:hypothetical protein